MASVDQSGLDLLLGLDRADSRSLRGQLEAELREAIRSGRLHAGTALPSSRALARELGVSRGVVVEAYSQLAAEGYLHARQGAATRVASVAAPRAPVAPAPAWDAPVRHDFRPQVPDLAAFPRREWLASLRRALAQAPDARLGYGDPRGAAELRLAIAAYLGRVRGVVGDAERTVVTGGIQQGLSLLVQALRARGARRIAIEEPGFFVHRRLLARLGVEVVRVPVDDHGIEVASLARREADAVLVTPAHQMPTGAVLAPERRAALLAWAAERDAVVIEDDYDGEYRYDREPVGALQGLDPERVVYLGSASKTLAPALRLGWVVLPSWLAEAAGEEKGWADGGSPVLEQLAFADFLERGELDRHLRRARPRYRRRRDALVAAVDEAFPGAVVRGVAAGLHVVAEPVEAVDERALRAAARERSVEIVAMRARGRTLLVLGYANLPEAAARRAVAELRRAYDATRRVAS
ncbi:MAG: GntR family transcriptional regulator / MocR family aminotransferase [Thermoleophilaceae bacterium]|nr:GntR family transcriptional regulator / MocR family aminotransferase [Thermoleophilaceae bacterium]